MDPSFRLESRPEYNHEPGDDELVVCLCCQGTGTHEQYSPLTDQWIQEDCVYCKGTGKLTVAQLNHWKRILGE